ncbi:hypothetical protein [Marinoscillum sp.]|uniref:hypothetical protein n=1 Tax=Marinoscillum sp. TaxID=2024838 RepID=UPI003BA8CB7F
METRKINTEFEQGEHFLEMAHEAMNFPNKGEMAYLTCINAKKALVDYLTSMLVHYGEEIYSRDAEVLLNQCRELSGNYLDLKIDGLLRWENGEEKPNHYLAQEIVQSAELARELMFCEML